MMIEQKDVKISKHKLSTEGREMTPLKQSFNEENVSVSLGNCYSQNFLPLYISQILIEKLPLNVRINKVIEHLGYYTGVSRVYIFENSEDDLYYCNTYEWCNTDVIPQIELLDKLPAKDVPSWMPLLIKDGKIESSRINDELPKDVVDALSPQNIKSILVYPLLREEKIIGFIGFDECLSTRVWRNHEKDLLATVAMLLSNALAQERILGEISREALIKQFLLDATFLLSDNYSQGEVFNDVSKKVVETTSAQGFAVYALVDVFSNTFALQGSSNLDSISVNYPSSIKISDGLLLKPRTLKIGNNVTADPLFDFVSAECTVLVVPIITTKGLNGFVVVNYSNELFDCPINISVLEALTTMIGRRFDHVQSELENSYKHKEILKINKELAEKERFLNSIISAAQLGIVIVKDRIIQYANDQAYIACQRRKGEFIGQSISTLYAENAENTEDIARFYREISSIGISAINVQLKKRNGQIMHCQVIGTLAKQYDNDNSVLLIGQDMTRVIQIENSLIESEERNRKILEANVDGIFIINKSGELVYANKAGCELTGYSKEQLSYLRIQNLFVNTKGIREYLVIKNKLQDGISYRGDSQLRHSNGTLLHVEINGTLISLEGEEHYYFGIHDITRRKHNEAALRISEKKFRSLSENIPDCVVRINRNGLFTYTNSMFSTLFNVSNLNESKRQIFHLSELPVNLAHKLGSAVAKVVKTQEIVKLEIEHVNETGFLTIDWSFTPEYDENGYCISVLGIGRDVTSRKEVERELLFSKEKAEAADRLKSAFLANMSHEIRTPLNAVVGFSNLLSKTEHNDEDREEFISLINRNAESLITLINDIIDIAKIESGHIELKLKAVEVNEFIKNVFVNFRKRKHYQEKGNVDLRLVEQNDLFKPLYVIADADKLTQIFNNLLDNAFKFIHKGYIEVGYEVKNNRIKFYVRDTGVGISKKMHKVVFEAFRQEQETTSKEYGGTGLGLAICKKLVEAMNGQMGLISEKGVGSEFYFLLDICKIETDRTKCKSTGNSNRKISQVSI